MEHVQQGHCLPGSELKFNLPFTDYLSSNGSSQSEFTIISDLFIGLEHTSVKGDMGGCTSVNPPSFALSCADCIYLRNNNNKLFLFSNISLRLSWLRLLRTFLSVATFSCKVSRFATNEATAFSLWLDSTLIFVEPFVLVLIRILPLKGWVTLFIPA